MEDIKEAMECLDYIENKLKDLKYECERTNNHRCDDLFITTYNFDTIKQVLNKHKQTLWLEGDVSVKKVYAVIETTGEHFDNDLCWENGYYDDYYETVVTSTDYLAFFTTEKEANKCSEYLNNERNRDTSVIEIMIDTIFNKEYFKEDFE